MIWPTSISLRNTLECINSYHDDLIHTGMHAYNCVEWNKLSGLKIIHKMKFLKVIQFLVSKWQVFMYFYYQINTTCIHRHNKVFANLIKNTDNAKPLYLPDVPHSQYQIWSTAPQHKPSGLLLKVNALSLSKSLCNRIKNCPMFT